MYSSLESVSNTSSEQYYASSLDQTLNKKQKKKSKLSLGYVNLKKYQKEYNSYNEKRKCHKRRHESVKSDEEVSESFLVFGPITKEEIQMKWRLSYFFMNPYEKFLARTRIPWKMVLQIIKLIILTYQLIDFGALRSMHINFVETSELSLKHLYLKDWSLSYETMPYPPALGKMAAYTKQDFYDSIDFLLNQYNSTQEITVGNFNFASKDRTLVPMVMCIKKYAVESIWSFNQSFILDTNLVKDCFSVVPVQYNDSMAYDIKRFLEQTNRTINFNGMIDVVLSFSLETIHIKSPHRPSEPDCYLFHTKVVFDNINHDGQVEIWLDNQIEYLPCHGKILYAKAIDLQWISSWLFNAFVLIVCTLSSSLCVRSFSRAMMLKKDTVHFFSKYYPEKRLTNSDLLELVDFWYILIVLNDVLTIMGCIVKILIQVKWSTSYELCGLLLGTGSLFAWFGVLRYLALFKSFNILIVTVKLAFPNVVKFLVCAFFIFIGFSICGWIVLGPVHIKFREFGTSLECLYSLINGDDIFATFASMNKTGFAMWLFSRLYLYIFMSLFIYVVLSMFISIIADTYDSIKHPESDLLMKSFLKRFSQNQLTPFIEEGQVDEKENKICEKLLRLFGYKNRNRTTEEDEDCPLIN